MAKRDYIADSAPLPHPSLAFQVRFNLTAISCVPTVNPVTAATDTTIPITQLSNR